MPEPLIRGVVDLGAPAGAIVANPSGGRLAGPGFEFCAAGCGAIAVDGSRIALATGTPRFDGAASAGSSAAARWLARWRERGENAPIGVRGAWAAALVDVAAGTALLATDRFSVQPICYAFDGRQLRFSDRADAVLPRAEQVLDPQAIYDYLYFHAIPAPRTVFGSVARLRGGHALAIASGRARVQRYWTAVFAESSRASFAELAAEFRRLLREAVARDAGAGSVGAFLSGGTDSSTVAGLVGEALGTPARTFSIGFDAEGYDEMAYARIAAQHFGTDHHEHYLTPIDLLAAIPRIAAHYDQPFGNSSVAPAYHCAARAREAGVDALLAGDGGDELFGGNSRYAKQRVFAAYGRLPPWLRDGLLEPLLLSVPGVDRLPVARKAASYVRQARVRMPERMEAYNLLERAGVHDVLEPAFLAQVDVADPAAQQRETYEETGDTSLVNRMLAYDWKYTLADNDLPKVTGAAALAGVAVRFPLLADELVDFSLALPAEFKVKGVRLRWFFKEALRGFLPDAIIAKRKHGFGLPFGVWLVRDGPLREFAGHALARLDAHGIVRREFVSSLLTRHVPEHPGYYGEMVWILMMLSEWLGAREAVRQPTLRTAAG